MSSFFNTVVPGDMQNVVKNQTAVKHITGDETIYNMSLMFLKSTGAIMTEAEIETDVDYVEITMSDDVQGQGIKLVDRIPASILNAMYKYHTAAKSSYTLSDGIFLDFARKGLVIAPASMAIGRREATPLIVEVKLKDVTLVVAKIVISYETDGNVMSLGPHIELGAISEVHAAKSVQSVDSINSGMAEKVGYLALHVTHGSGTLDNVSVNRKENAGRKLDIYKELDSAMNKRFLHEAGKTPQSDFFSVEFSRWGDALMVDGGNCTGLDVKFDWSQGSAAPDDYKIYLESLVGLEFPNNIEVA